MKNNIANKVLEYIESLGDVMSNGAKYGFEVMVKQNFTSGLIDVITSLPFVLVLIFATYKLTRLAVTKWDDLYASDMEFLVGFGLMLLFIFTGVMTVVGYIATVEGLKMMINPEYYAIKDILDTLK
jgi:hypothetical protein